MEGSASFAAKLKFYFWRVCNASAISLPAVMLGTFIWLVFREALVSFTSPYTGPGACTWVVAKAYAYISL